MSVSNLSVSVQQYLNRNLKVHSVKSNPANSMYPVFIEAHYLTIFDQSYELQQQTYFAEVDFDMEKSRESHQVIPLLTYFGGFLFCTLTLKAAGACHSGARPTAHAKHRRHSCLLLLLCCASLCTSFTRARTCLEEEEGAHTFIPPSQSTVPPVPPLVPP